MTLYEIDRTIHALEKSSLTFGNCQKLASLYICREHFIKNNKKFINEENIEKFKDSKII